MIDTHAHLFSEEFDADIAQTIQRAKQAGVKHIILPNVDSESLVRMLALEASYPDYCSATIGLHPTSVSENYQHQLDLVKSELARRKYIAIGEIGIDLYWDKTHYKEQILCLQQQIEWALHYDLPVIIHMRDSFHETLQVLQEFKATKLRGVFHSFVGTYEQAVSLLDFEHFYLGINGIVTFKNSGLSEVLPRIAISRLLIETDAPYLSPVPYRGKRNETSYLPLILQKLAACYAIDEKTIEKQLNLNTKALFGL